MFLSADQELGSEGVEIELDVFPAIILLLSTRETEVIC
jgi:hypothetical protein